MFLCFFLRPAVPVVVPEPGGGRGAMIGDLVVPQIGRVQPRPANGTGQGGVLIAFLEDIDKVGVFLFHGVGVLGK